MSILVTLMLAGLLAARELLRAYRGSDVRHIAWFRYLDYAILVTLFLFTMVIALQIYTVLTEVV